MAVLLHTFSAAKRVCCSFPLSFSTVAHVKQTRLQDNRPWFPSTVTINWRRFMSTVNTLWWEKVDTNDTADFASGKTLQANQIHQRSDKWFQAICVTQHSLKSRPLIYGPLCSFKWRFVSFIKIIKGAQWGQPSYSKCWQCAMPSG